MGERSRQRFVLGILLFLATFRYHLLAADSITRGFAGVTLTFPLLWLVEHSTNDQVTWKIALMLNSVLWTTFLLSVFRPVRIGTGDTFARVLTRRILIACWVMLLVLITSAWFESYFRELALVHDSRTDEDTAVGYLICGGGRAYVNDGIETYRDWPVLLIEKAPPRWFLLHYSGRSSGNEIATVNETSKGFGVAGLAYRHMPRHWSTTEQLHVLVVPFWFLFGGVALVPLVRWGLAHVRRRTRLRGHLCVACGYDLRATPQRCPECGTEVEHPSAMRSVWCW